MMQTMKGECFVVHRGVGIVQLRRSDRGAVCRVARMSHSERIVGNVRNARGIDLSVLIRSPKSGDSAATILCHGFQSSKRGQLMTRLAEGMSGTSVRFDFSGNGESGGRFRYAGYWDEVEDLRAVIEHVRGLGIEVRSIVGHSKGGNVVLMYAYKYGDVKLVVNVAGRFDMRRGVVERFGDKGVEEILAGQLVVSGANGEEYVVARSDLEERFSIDMEKIVGGIDKQVAVLTIHGDMDETIRVEDGRKVCEASGGEIEVMVGGDHRLGGMEARIVERMGEFGAC